MVVINIFAIIYVALLFVLYKPLCEYLRVDSLGVKKTGNGKTSRKRKGKSGNNSKNSISMKNITVKNIAPEQEKVIGKTLFITILVAAGLARFFTAFILAVKGYPGHKYDMGCFRAWSEMIRNSGIGKFYKSEGFHDYPPGYMYILYILANIRNALGIDVNGALYNVMLKLPAIASDLGIGVLIYKEASKRFKERGAAIVAGLFFFFSSCNT